MLSSGGPISDSLISLACVASGWKVSLVNDISSPVMTLCTNKRGESAFVYITSDRQFYILFPDGSRYDVGSIIDVLPVLKLVKKMTKE